MKPFFMILFLALNVGSPSSKTDFSGNYRLNENASSFGDTNFRMAPENISIKQNNSTIEVTRLYVGPSGEEINTQESISLDGAKTTSALFGNSTKTSTAKWSEDGKTLTIVSLLELDMDGNKIEMDSMEQWNISGDGSQLTILSETSSSFGTRKDKLVFNKNN